MAAERLLTLRVSEDEIQHLQFLAGVNGLSRSAMGRLLIRQGMLRDAFNARLESEVAEATEQALARRAATGTPEADATPEATA